MRHLMPPATQERDSQSVPAGPSHSLIPSMAACPAVFRSGPGRTPGFVPEEDGFSPGFHGRHGHIGPIEETFDHGLLPFCEEKALLIPELGRPEVNFIDNVSGT